MPNLTGPKGRLYAEPKPTPDEDAFLVNNTSDAYYNSQYYLLNKSLVQRIPPPRPGVPPFLKLDDFVPQEISDAIAAAGKIVFHTWGTPAPPRWTRGIWTSPPSPRRPPSPMPWPRMCNPADWRARLFSFT
jgi:hypothetical protein